MFRFPAIPILLVSLLLVAANCADAGWVFYFRVFDQWSVVCDRQMPNGEKTCQMSAPPPELTGTPNRITVHETAPGSFSVSVRMATWTDPKRPLSVRIDDNPPITVTAGEWGDVQWTGGDAATLVAQMKNGEQAVLISHTQDGRKHEEAFSLSGFAAAFTILRQNLRLHGIIGGK